MKLYKTLSDDWVDLEKAVFFGIVAHGQINKDLYFYVRAYFKIPMGNMTNEVFVDLASFDTHDRALEFLNKLIEELKQ